VSLDFSQRSIERIEWPELHVRHGFHRMTVWLDSEIFAASLRDAAHRSAEQVD
jgi:hypothetical protein